MKVIINSNDVAKRLKKAERAIDAKSLFPILENFLISIKGGSASVTSSNNEVAITMALPIVSSDEDFDICVSAKKFSSFIGSIKNANVEIEKKGMELLCKHPRGRFTLPCMEPSDFPLLKTSDESRSISIASVDLQKAISSTEIACSNDDLRPQLKGLFFDFTDDKLTLVATDTHKLVKYDIGAQNTNHVNSFIAPRKATMLLTSMIEQYDGLVTIKNDDARCEFSVDNDFSIVFTQIGGKYPNYNAVFPTDYTKQALITSGELIESLQRVLLSDTPISCVSLSFGLCSVNITTQNLDYNISAEENIECEYTGDELKISFNGNDLITLVNGLQLSRDEKFIIRLKEQGKPILINPCDDNKFSAILMPLFTV